MICVYVDRNEYINQINYVFEIINEVAGINLVLSDDENMFKNSELIIAYVEDITSITDTMKEKNKIVIQNSKKLFGDAYLRAQSLPSTIKKLLYESEELISIYSSEKDVYIEGYENSIITNMDLIADIFFMLSRYEEVVKAHVMKEEVFERFPASESLAYRCNFLDRPIVNEHIELIVKWIKRFKSEVEIPNLWEEKRFAACLTHDVDWIQKHFNFKSALRSSIGLVVRQKSMVGATRNLNTYFKSLKDYENDMYWTFDYIIDCEKKNGFKSSFYFMAGGNSEFDNNYRYDDFRVVRLIDKLSQQNFECGYHGSFNSYNDLAMMKAEKDNLDKVIRNKEYGMRQHYLRFKVPDTWRNQKLCDFLYDTTLGFADKEGFRAGFCLPFRPYDILKDEVIDMWEIPLIVMEASLMNSKYRGYTPEEAFINIKHLIDVVCKHGGVFTMLWHNSSFDKSNLMNSRWKSVYESVLKYLNEKECHGASGKDILLRYMGRIE